MTTKLKAKNKTVVENTLIIEQLDQYSFLRYDTSEVRQWKFDIQKGCHRHMLKFFPKAAVRKGEKLTKSKLYYKQILTC